MEDFNLFHQSQMNSIEGGFHTREIVGDKFRESLFSSSEASQTSFEKPAKMAKTNDWNSFITHHVPPKPSSSSSSQFLSFVDTHYQRVSIPIESFPSQRKIQLPPLMAKEINQSSAPLKGTKRSSSTRRTPNPNDHIIAERKRREKLSQRFIALSAIVPGLKKMDKASVLGDTIKYVKQLHERVQFLEEQTKKKTMESVVFIKKSQISVEDDSSSSDENFDGGSDQSFLPEIEARVSEKSVLLRIHCGEQKGFLPKIINEIEKFHLSILHSSVLPFGSSTLDITLIAEMEDEFKMTVKDLVRNIRMALIKFA